MKLESIEIAHFRPCDIAFCRNEIHGYDCGEGYRPTAQQLKLTETLSHQVVLVVPCDENEDRYFVSWRHVVAWRPRKEEI